MEKNPVFFFWISLSKYFLKGTPCTNYFSYSFLKCWKYVKHNISWKTYFKKCLFFKNAFIYCARECRSKTNLKEVLYFFLENADSMKFSQLLLSIFEITFEFYEKLYILYPWKFVWIAFFFILIHVFRLYFIIL